MPIKEEYTVNEVASILQTNPETVRKWIKEGKLAAIPGNSKKEGMRIEEPSLEDFLADNPKYTKSAYITAAAAILTGGIAIPASVIINAQRKARETAQKEDDALTNARIRTTDMIRLLEEEISQESQTILEKRKLKTQLEKEIREKENRIANIKQMISDLESDDSEKKSQKTSSNKKLTISEVSGSRKMRLGKVHKKKADA